MSNEDKPNEAISGEVIPNERGAGNTLDLNLQQPPDAARVPFTTAMLQRYEYRKLRLILDAYRRAIASGVDAVEAQTRFYQAIRDLDMEKGRWGNREQFREAARKDAEVLIERAEAETAEARTRTEEAQTRRMRSQVERRTLQEKLAAADTNEEIAENNRAVELEKSKRQREEEEQRSADQRNSTETSDFDQKLAEFEQARADYEKLMARKAVDVERYGSEENFPEYLVTMYEKLEDEIGFRGE